jgi:aspartokinase
MPKVAGANASFYDAREYDAIVASGEQVTSGLLAIALQSMGVDARSWQGWQIPVKTDNAHGAARIVDIDGSELIRASRSARWRWLPVFRASGRTTGWRRLAAADRTPARWPLPPR